MNASHRRKSTNRSLRVSALIATVLIVVGFRPTAVFADYTSASANATQNCGGDCGSAQVPVAFVKAPGFCSPTCTIYSGVGPITACSPLESVMLHIPDSGDLCVDADAGPFPVDLLAGSFQLTGAQWQSLLSGDYMVRAAFEHYCSSSGGFCINSGDCPGGETCLAPGSPNAPPSKTGTPPPPPTVAKPYKMHFPQNPDEEGWNVLATDPQILADDWLCTESGPVSDIHFWGSWLDDVVGNIVAFDLRIYSDVPGAPFSKPGTMLWQWVAPAGSWLTTQIGPGPLEGWYDPATATILPNNHPNYFQYDFNPIPKEHQFFQHEGTIYWLAVSAIVAGSEQWGWKSSVDHFNDAAVWGPGGPPWINMFEPTGVKQRLDLSFVITGSGHDIPTLSEWAVVAMTLLLLAAGTVVFRRLGRSQPAT